MIYSQNFVRIAVDRIGGATKAAHLAEVSNATVHSWIKRQRISNINKARTIAESSGIDLLNLRDTL